MKLLLDENLPLKLKFRFLDKGIEAFTISDLKWNSKTNGELLQLMIKEGFSHLVTFDASISFQQNFIKYPIPVVIIIAHSNSYNIIMEIFDELLTQISESKEGANTVIHPLKKS